MKGEMGLCAVLRAHSSPIHPVDVMSFTALVNITETFPNKGAWRSAAMNKEPGAPNLPSAAGKKAPPENCQRKYKSFFTICLKYCLEHTYIKNYSSFAENSNLMGPPGFLLAVFGNCAPRPHGSQTLEGERKQQNPCVCRVHAGYFSDIYLLFPLWVLPDAWEERGRYLHPHQSCQRNPSPGHRVTSTGVRGTQQSMKLSAKAHHLRCCPNNTQASIPLWRILFWLDTWVSLFKWCKLLF